MAVLSPFLLLALSGCDSLTPHVAYAQRCWAQDTNNDGRPDKSELSDPILFYADNDNDGYGDATHPTEACSPPSGYTVRSDDCNDKDHTTHPDADEYCDGVDNDCDGSIDLNAVDAVDWYLDVDDDGYGAGAASLTACAAPVDYANADGDCDDTNAEINPGEQEICDGIDNDCDDAIDDSDDDFDASTTRTWYADADGDGFGESGGLYTQDACTQPSGYVANSSDCDDTNATNYPKADEYCDGDDNDCDDNLDEAALDVSAWYADSDGDGYGDAKTSVSACNPPSGYVIDSTDCNDALASSHPGAWDDCENGVDENCDGVDRDCEFALWGADVEFLGEAGNDAAGASVASAGDVDSDGYDDFLFGARGESSNGNLAGATYLTMGSATGTVGSTSAKFLGEGDLSFAGGSVAGAGDINADGYADLIIGAAYEDTTGAAYLVLGGTKGTLTGTLYLKDAAAKFLGEEADDSAGGSVSSAGDVDGDGYGDLLIGAPARNSGTGATYLIFGPTTGEQDLADADAQFVGEAISDFSGDRVVGGGDINSDGYDDLFIGAYAESTSGTDAGAAYLILGPISGENELADADAKFTGEGAGDSAGGAVSGAGDVNNDGYDDLLIGAYAESTSGTDAGAAYLILGPVTGANALADADAKLIAEDGDDYVGRSVSSAGDVDNDGHTDILIGAQREDSAGSDAGAAYLVLGTISGTIDLGNADVKFTGRAVGHLAGCAVAGIGDVDADGQSDLLIGAYGESSVGDDSGAAYLILGASL